MLPGPRLVLANHHSQIEAACEALRAAAYDDDACVLVARYRTLEHAVLAHLQAEEDEILPAYAVVAPADAAAIRTAHAELRRRLFGIAVDVELHAVRAVSLKRLIEALRLHLAHEDRAMYPWAEAHLPPHSRRELLARMAHSLHVLGHEHEPSRPTAALPLVE